MAKVDFSKLSTSELHEKLARLRSERHGAVSRTTSGKGRRKRKVKRKNVIDLGDLDMESEENDENKGEPV